MKKNLLVSVFVLLITFLCVACNKSSPTSTENAANVLLLNNGVEITLLNKYNSENLVIDNTKSAEMVAIENYYTNKLAEDAWLFETSDSQISWCWGNPENGDGIHDLVLCKQNEDGTYALDLNYDLRTDISNDVSSTDSRDIVRFMLSFVTSNPTLVEEQIYMDIFINDESSIPMKKGWYNIADCDLQWNADNGYGLTIVIKEHIE